MTPFRVIARKNREHGGKCRALAIDLTDRLALIVEAFARLQSPSCILDR
jgi:hypothetical protein